MNAAAFQRAFDSLVVAPASATGFERWGKSLRFERHGLRAAVLRTELRFTWPFKLTLVVSHDVLRDFEDRHPAPWSRNVSEWPIKLAPSEAASLLSTWRYRPFNSGNHPGDVMKDGQVEVQLQAIGEAIEVAFATAVAVVTPRAVLEQLLAHGEGAWCEQRWIADYSAAVSAE